MAVAPTHFRGAVRKGWKWGDLHLVVASTHFRGAVREAKSLELEELVVASTHFRGAVRSNRANRLGCWARRQQSLEKMVQYLAVFRK